MYKEDNICILTDVIVE